MTSVPNKGYISDIAPNVDNVKSNTVLNIPALKINTVQSPLSNPRPIKMKQPERMRTDGFTGNPDSSAIESPIIVSDYGETSRRQGRGVKRNLFVSAKYSRRASSHSVTFRLPESDNTNGKDLNRNVIFSDDTDVKTNSNDENSEKDIFSSVDRRMSAPELPPISTNGKSSSLVTNGFLTARSNTFHNYRFNTESRKSNRKSIHSDSSIQGYRLNSQSRTSSSSSQKSRGRVLSAGTDRRTNNPVVTEGDHLVEIPPTPNKKIDKKKSGMPTMVVPARCQSVTQMRRANSKLSLVNQKLNTPRGSSLKHANSEGTLVQRGTNNDILAGQQTSRQITDTKKPIKRISSDKSLTDQKNSKNSTTGNGLTRTAHSLKGTTKSVNGIKKTMTSSRLSSKADEKKSDSGSLEQIDFDSDSDCDRDKRVKDWILGVTDAEPPEEPDIEYVEEPPQRDTAIRIVYEGDS